MRASVTGRDRASMRSSIRYCGISGSLPCPFQPSSRNASSPSAISWRSSASRDTLFLFLHAREQDRLFHPLKRGRCGKPLEAVLDERVNAQRRVPFGEAEERVGFVELGMQQPDDI